MHRLWSSQVDVPLPTPPAVPDPGSYEAHMVPLDSTRGQALAASLTDGWASRAAELVACFEPQEHGAWCALASSAIALRALGASAVPSQRQLYDRHFAAGMRNGVSLTQLHALMQETLLAALAVDVALRIGDDGARLVETLSADLLLGEADGSVVLINFLRQLGGHWTGHWSVLGGIAFDEVDGEPYALVLDVAAHKAAPHWVPLPLLAACICTRNRFGESRGYLRLAPHDDSAPSVNAPPPGS